MRTPQPDGPGMDGGVCVHGGPCARGRVGREGGGWKKGAAGFCGWCEVLQPLMQVAHSSPAHETEGPAGVAGWGERFPQAFEASRDPTSREETVKLRPETGGH